jgi:hypothetical protein
MTSIVKNPKEDKRMNERLIQDLMNKSYVDVDKYNNRFSPEKFAELIIRECVAICQDIDGEDSSDGRCARQDCSVEIREHFGVEEE